MKSWSQLPSENNSITPIFPSFAFPNLEYFNSLTKFESVSIEGFETFPKQTYRLNEQDVGNWLNLPYFDKDRTLRYAIKDGKALKYSEFIEYAKTKMLTLEEVNEIGDNVENGDDLFVKTSLP